MLTTFGSRLIGKGREGIWGSNYNWHLLKYGFYKILNSGDGSNCRWYTIGSIRRIWIDGEDIVNKNNSSSMSSLFSNSWQQLVISKTISVLEYKPFFFFFLRRILFFCLMWIHTEILQESIPVFSVAFFSSSHSAFTQQIFVECILLCQVLGPGKRV